MCVLFFLDYVLYLYSMTLQSDTLA